MSIVQYVDSERVALSRQFFNKTRANLDANPQAQVRVVEPQTMQQYTLDLQYVHTETEGPTFDAMRANLEAIASQTGMGDVFRLRGVDIHRVVRCAPADDHVVAGPVRASQRDLLGPLDELMRRVALCDQYEDATRTALQALDDLFGFEHTILLVLDERGDRLFAVASNGYASSSAGAEVALGEGVIGTAAERRRVVCVPNLARSRAMSAAVRASLERRGEAPPGREIPLPGLAGAQSAAAVPLTLHGQLAGVLYLEGEEPGRFGPDIERLLRVLSAYLAPTLAVLEAERSDSSESVAPPAPAPATTKETVPVSYYQADDSVFVDGEYLIRGVPGRILWRLLRDYVSEGRTAFTNRELRLDEGLGLPAGADNLEARLLVLRKRLDEADCGIRLERIGRGRLALEVTRELGLSEVPTSGPMRAAHASPQAS
jgi:adenylate cyclase